MTAYCTRTDLELEVRPVLLVQLTNDDDGDTVDETVLARAIERASSEIDAAAGARYVVPFDPIPLFIRNLCVDMTLAGLAFRRELQPDWAKVRRKRADQVLQQLADGALTVGVQPEPARNPERLGTGQAMDRTFPSDPSKGSWF